MKGEAEQRSRHESISASGSGGNLNRHSCLTRGLFMGGRMKTWALAVFVLTSVFVLSTAPNARGGANKECTSVDIAELPLPHRDGASHALAAGPDGCVVQCVYTPWSDPVNMGEPINSPDNNSHSWITKDGLSLYITTTRFSHSDMDQDIAVCSAAAS